MNKRLILSISLIIFSIFCFSFAQADQGETLTITTYYPSPYGVYRNLEVKRGLAVGDITQGPLGNMNNLQTGQIYVNSSVILNSLSSYPPAPWRAGQVIYFKHNFLPTWLDYGLLLSQLGRLLPGNTGGRCQFRINDWFYHARRLV